MKIPYLLSVITWLPALGALIVLFLFNKSRTGAIKRFATYWFLLDFVVSLALIGYDRNLAGVNVLRRSGISQIEALWCLKSGDLLAKRLEATKIEGTPRVILLNSGL